MLRLHFLAFDLKQLFQVFVLLLGFLPVKRSQKLVTVEIVNGIFSSYHL